MSKFGERLINAAKEAQAIARGEADPDTYAIHVPDDVDVRGIRTFLKLTQNEFAMRYGFKYRTVQDWELGRSRPTGHTRAYLTVIARNPGAVNDALAAAPSTGCLKKTARRRPVRARTKIAADALRVE